MVSDWLDFNQNYAIMVKMETLKLSDLMKIGIRYIQLDCSNTIFFNDGTIIYSRYYQFTNDDGTSFDDLEVVCKRGKQFFHVVDDIYKTLPEADRLNVGHFTKKEANSVWSTEY